MSLSYQINIRILLFSLLILLLGGGIAVWQARTAVTKEIDASLNLTAHLISCGLAQKVQDHAAWLSCFNSLSETRHLTITLVKPSGASIGGNQANATNDSHSLPPQWFINLIGRQQANTERQVTTSLGEEYSLRIQANPMDEVKEAWYECLAFFSSIVLLTQLTFLSVYLALRNTINSIRAMVGALQRVEKGDYQQTLPEFETAETNRIAKAINHMTSELKIAQQDNRALVQHSLTLLENERKQLAQELHDELGQSLTAIKMMALAAQREKTDSKEITRAIAGICDDLTKVVRSIMTQLHPLTLMELGLKAAVEDLLSHWSAKIPDLKFKFNCPAAVDAINQNISIQIFRVLQECVTNIIRHAEAKNCQINISLNENQISLTIKDDGKGCPVEQLTKGFGVLGMKERIHSLGGSVILESHPYHGVEVRADIPLMT